MQVTLTILSGPEKIGETFSLKPGENFVGRVSPPCSIQLNGSKLSKRHCVFVVSEDSLLVKDLRSSNGVFVNGNKVENKVLANRDRLILGDFLVEVKVEK
jgi:pSer/pThr/pTyr-binding forkhead associated (FHA) protein